MNGVIPIIVRKKVEHWAHKVPRVVVLTVFIAAVVLEQVERDNTPLRVQMGDKPQTQRLAPVENEYEYCHNAKDDEFKH